MARMKGKYMTVREFAEKMNVDRVTVQRWLSKKLIPGAEALEPMPGVRVWKIPAEALKMPRPAAGRPRETKVAAKPAKRKPAQPALFDTAKKGDK